MLREVWFWFSIVVCPLLIIAGIYNVGFIVGYIAYVDFAHLTQEQLVRVIAVGVGICATFIFVRGFKQAKLRFSSES